MLKHKISHIIASGFLGVLQLTAVSCWALDCKDLDLSELAGIDRFRQGTSGSNEPVPSRSPVPSKAWRKISNAIVQLDPKNLHPQILQSIYALAKKYPLEFLEPSPRDLFSGDSQNVVTPLGRLFRVLIESASITALEFERQNAQALRQGYGDQSFYVFHEVEWRWRLILVVAELVLQASLKVGLQNLGQVLSEPVGSITQDYLKIVRPRLNFLSSSLETDKVSLNILTLILVFGSESEFNPLLESLGAALNNQTEGQESKDSPLVSSNANKSLGSGSSTKSPVFGAGQSRQQSLLLQILWEFRDLPGSHPYLSIP